MERLTEAQRANISKMTSKLLQAGYCEEVVAQLGRTELISTFAEILAPESAQAMAKVDRGEEMLRGWSRCGQKSTKFGREEIVRLILEEQRLEEQRYFLFCGLCVVVCGQDILDYSQDILDQRYAGCLHHRCYLSLKRFE